MAYRNENGIMLHETVRVGKDEIDFNADKDFSVIYDYKKVPSNFQWLREIVCWCCLNGTVESDFYIGWCLEETTGVAVVLCLYLVDFTQVFNINLS